MERYRVMLPIAVMLIAILGCRWSRDANTGTSERTVPAVPSMEAEAKGQLKKYLDRHLTTCGDSWVVEKSNGMDGNGIFQYKNPSITILRVGNISEADRLNGVEWSGLLDMG